MTRHQRIPTNSASPDIAWLPSPWPTALAQEVQLDRLRVELAHPAVQGVFDRQALERAVLLPGLEEEWPGPRVRFAHTPPTEAAGALRRRPTHPAPHAPPPPSAPEPTP